MDRGGEKPHEMVIDKCRGDHGEIKKMAGAKPGIISHVHIAWSHTFQRYLFKKIADRGCHGVDMTRRAGNGLGQHATVEIKDAGGKIPGLPYGG